MMFGVVENQTGTSSKTITYFLDGSFKTTWPTPVCSECKEPMDPMIWLCGRCGEVADG